MACDISGRYLQEWTLFSFFQSLLFAASEDTPRKRQLLTFSDWCHKIHGSSFRLAFHWSGIHGLKYRGILQDTEGWSNSYLMIFTKFREECLCGVTLDGWFDFSSPFQYGVNMFPWEIFVQQWGSHSLGIHQDTQFEPHMLCLQTLKFC